MNITPHYIVNQNNQKIAVQLDISTFEKMLEVMENYALYQFMQNENEQEYLTIENALDFYKNLPKSWTFYTAKNS